MYDPELVCDVDQCTSREPGPIIQISNYWAHNVGPPRSAIANTPSMRDQYCTVRRTATGWGRGGVSLPAAVVWPCPPPRCSDRYSIIINNQTGYTY